MPVTGVIVEKLLFTLQPGLLQHEPSFYWTAFVLNVKIYEQLKQRFMFPENRQASTLQPSGLKSSSDISAATWPAYMMHSSFFCFLLWLKRILTEAFERHESRVLKSTDDFPAGSRWIIDEGSTPAASLRKLLQEQQFRGMKGLFSWSLQPQHHVFLAAGSVLVHISCSRCRPPLLLQRLVESPPAQVTRGEEVKVFPVRSCLFCINDTEMFHLSL